VPRTVDRDADAEAATRQVHAFSSNGSASIPNNGCGRIGAGDDGTSPNRTSLRAATEILLSVLGIGLPRISSTAHRFGEVSANRRFASIQLQERVHNFFETHYLPARGPVLGSQDGHRLCSTGLRGPRRKDRALFSRCQGGIDEHVGWTLVKPAWVHQPIKFVIGCQKMRGRKWIAWPLRHRSSPCNAPFTIAPASFTPAVFVILSPLSIYARGKFAIAAFA
jgi:hypothetical protein